MDLDAYRRSAEAFVSELDGEFYRHYAGLQDDFGIEAIYERHVELFTRESVEALRGGAANTTAGTDEHRRQRMLLDFAVDGHLGQATKELDAEIARREAELSLELDGDRIGFRESAVVQSNEPDPERRERIEQARLALTASELNPLYQQSLETQHQLAHELGFASYKLMCAELKALDLDGLRAQTEAFRAATDASYPELLAPELSRTLGIDGLEQLRRSDLPRFFRTAELDGYFPKEQLVESFFETAGGLGIDVQRQPGVVLDVEPRPNKSPRAFCAPVRVPGEVYLVIAPVGGREDFAALFHEGGHTEHFAHVDPQLPFEFRHLGDNSITEAYAFLLEHLTEDPEWLARRLPGADTEPIVAHARAERLVYLRRYVAKLAYELELHAGDGDGDGARRLSGLQDRYAQLLGSSLGIDWPGETFLSDVDRGFYCAAYLRAWALETHLRAHLRERFGPAWFDEPAAGAELRRLWRDGQRLSAEELLGELTGRPLDFGVMLDDLGL
jgi:hypothetical protein